MFKEYEMKTVICRTASIGWSHCNKNYYMCRKQSGKEDSNITTTVISGRFFYFLLSSFCGSVTLYNHCEIILVLFGNQLG